MKWICSQIGARQHYTVPLALNRRRVLDCFLTDIWLPPNTLGARLNPKLAGRFHPELASLPVYTLNNKAFAFEAVSYLLGIDGGALMERRNEWYQQQILRKLSRKEKTDVCALHTFSYAGLHLLKFARGRGWLTVMQQIDPGPIGERIVSQLYEAHPEFRGNWQRASRSYWDKWREECVQADRIVVNSNWSREALRQEGIPDRKLSIIPLSYEPSNDAQTFVRTYPAEFNLKRPLRVLFLGQIDLGKGLFPLLESTELLRGEPIEFWFAGPMRVTIPHRFKRNSAIRWFGAVSRSSAPGLYRDADVFVFPTFSDGFGLTQLEAQAWKLPVISTRFCGDVVVDNVNGLLLPAVSGTVIAKILLDLARDPWKLRTMAADCRVEERFSVDAHGEALLALRNQ